MQLNQRLYDAMYPRAGKVMIEYICLGLGYTAVTTSDGSVGLSYTYFGHKTGCTLLREYQDFEGCPATELLSMIHSSVPLERSMALALINALAHTTVVDLPSDRNNGLLFDILNIGTTSKVAMVGYFKPLVGILESRGATVEIIDEFRGMGEKKPFYRKLHNWADAALITSTSLLNNSFEEIMDHAGANIHAALLGPSTPMVTTVFSDWPAIKALAGIVPQDKEMILKSVRHGLGTPYLHQSSKKVTLRL